MNLLAQIETRTVDYSGLKVLLPLSGGINSAACLCWLGEAVSPERWPLELYLYYSHFREHSPGTLRFVLDLIRYAKRTFPVVKWKVTRNSVNEYFIKEKMIPHPTISPCSSRLKINPAKKYFDKNEIDFELIGYVITDLIPHGGKPSRYERARVRSKAARFPILEWSKEDCLVFVKQIIGWYPALYDIKDENGKDVFSHNNCLPCKNMSLKQLQNVARYYPEHARRAEETAAAIPGAYWGREDVPGVFACDVCERLS